MVDLTRTVSALSAQSRCAALPSTFITPGLASIETQYVTGGTNVSLPNVGIDCLGTFNMAAGEIYAPQNLCFASLSINTTSTSTNRVAMWLPDNWNGRFLGTGTAGLSGCVDYPGLSYGASLNFAAAGTDAGHTGVTGAAFLNAPEVFTDFASRGVHLEAVVGKQIIETYYGLQPSYSYYSGCSGAAGMGSMRQRCNFPDDFDGILAGAPAVNGVNLFAWFALVSKPFMATEPGVMTSASWGLVRNETMKQCDHLDGAVDGTISYPEDCKFDPATLLCSATQPQPDCLNAAQVDGLKQLYGDMYDPTGQFFFPHYNAGAELSNPTLFIVISGVMVPMSFFTYQAWSNVVYSDPTWPGTNFTWSDIAAGQVKLAEIETWTGDLRAFKGRGGKLITTHGTEDTLIPAGVSTRQHAMTAAATGKHDMDDWYALYLVPGLNHCVNMGSVATGAWKFGQLGTVPEPRAASNDSEHNALLALVDWVEKGKDPKKLVGMTDTGETREVCRYPSQGRWIKGKWKCGPRHQ
ncbi:Tannase/feruloyl esterase [Auriculariales sp. MPI-PUGE-AT-0066]|nr:Tannase/feruloyl esterase [Auriculariales sp. MPI-PUGE-AT-0066]